MIAVDTLVHNFLYRTGIQSGYGTPHNYGAACYAAGGCAEVIRNIARLTAIFPIADWSLYLLGMTNATVTLRAAWRISTSYLTPEKRAVGLALLTLIQFFNFPSLIYDHNSLLMPFWALTSLFFLRSFENRKWSDALFAGILLGWR